MPVYSTRQAAKKLGISWPTLNRFIASGKIPVPPVTELGSARVRVWSPEDIEKARRVLPSIKNGRKIRYQKLRKKQRSEARTPRKKGKT
jgi:predicted site-specific integrase-resolvase